MSLSGPLRDIFGREACCHRRGAHRHSSRGGQRGDRRKTSTVKRQFDRSKYLNNPRTLTDEQYAARLQVAREKAQQARPSVFWLRATASLTLTLLMGALVDWLADWSTLRTAIVVVTCMVASGVLHVLTWRYLKRLPRSL
jgi:hypothetical protein